jgi:NAD(P)-dependent dehydrogenase (short-subunit alcohol dehydrogenase family)
MSPASRNAIVTGAASGLGRAIAVRLAADGWRIALADVDAEGSAHTKELVERAGGIGQLEPLDVSQPGDWMSLRGRLRCDWERLDLLVNNAGVAGYGDVGTFPLEDWHWLLNINLYGAIYGCHTMIEWLKQNEGQSNIINVASFAAIAPSPSMAAYNVAKAGVVALSETLHGELRPHGVGVTVVCPMYFRTRLTEGARSYNEVRSQIIHEQLERSTLTAEYVADVALAAMRRKELYAIPGWQARWYWWLRRLAPAGFLESIARDLSRRNSADARTSTVSSITEAE